MTANKKNIPTAIKQFVSDLALKLSKSNKGATAIIAGN